jgi:hypothetical protein
MRINIIIIILLLAISSTASAAELRPYIINKNDDIWHAEDPSSYITPDNPVVKEMADKLYLDDDGKLRYKNVQVPHVIDEKGNVIQWTDKTFINNYVSDDVQFNHPQNGDYWMNADYYLTQGMKGDCADWMIAVMSMFRSGEMSIKQGDSFIKQKLPAKAVIGYAGGIRDNWVEYKVHNKTFFTSTGLKIDRNGRSVSFTVFSEKDSQLKPIFEFDDIHFEEYNQW